MSNSPIVAVYSDGGMIGPANPSALGVTWAWCHVDAGGERVRERSGILVPADLGPAWTTLSNNVAEFAALARCLSALPVGWSGPVYCDSQITLGRFFQEWKLSGVPDGWMNAVQRNLARLGKLEPILLGGHPNKAELAAGVRRDGKPVSRYNVWCDQECTRRAGEWLAVHLSGEPGST